MGNALPQSSKRTLLFCLLSGLLVSSASAQVTATAPTTSASGPRRQRRRRDHQVRPRHQLPGRRPHPESQHHPRRAGHHSLHPITPRRSRVQLRLRPLHRELPAIPATSPAAPRPMPPSHRRLRRPWLPPRLPDLWLRRYRRHHLPPHRRAAARACPSAHASPPTTPSASKNRLFKPLRHSRAVPRRSSLPPPTSTRTISRSTSAPSPPNPASASTSTSST